MIIKEADDQSEDLAFLTQLTKRADLAPMTVDRIKTEIRNIEAGRRAEQQAAYQLKLYYGGGTNWMVINDLRIEHGGLVAQIDHLLINRLLHFWLCETKSFASGVEINEHGEFMRNYNGQLSGMASPIKQNNAHLRVFDKLLSSGLVKMPKRLGLTLKRELNTLVLVSDKARITRPKVSFAGLSSVIKADQLRTTINVAMDTMPTNQLLRLIGSQTLEALAREIAALHKPAKTNWLAKFGIAEPDETAARSAQPATASGKGVAMSAKKASGQAPTCETCGVKVSSGIVAYCQSNGRRFGWEIYCMACQSRISDTTASTTDENHDSCQG